MRPVYRRAEIGATQCAGNPGIVAIILAGVLAGVLLGTASGATAGYGPSLQPRFSPIGTERYFEPDDGLPIPIEIDARGDAALGAEASLEAARQALAAWSNIDGTGVAFVDGGPTADLTTGCPGPNKILFNDPEGLLPPPEPDPLVPGQCRGVLAMAITRRSSFESKVFANRNFSRTRCGFVVVNDGWGECSNWTPCNLAEVLTHELGHLLGLDHSSERDDEPNPRLREAAMYFRAHFDGRCAAVRDDDEDGARFLYPTDLPVTITTGSPMPGAFLATPYDLDLAATGGAGGYLWSRVRGTADGLVVEPDGRIGGAPERAGNVFLVARAQDASGDRHDKILEIDVSATPIPSPSPTFEPPPTPTTPPTPSPTATATATPSPSPAPVTGVCPGDCDGDGFVTVDEIVTVVNIALGLAPIADCRAVDTDGNGQASVDELVTMINHALNGCPPAVVWPDDWEEAFDASAFGWVMSGWGPGDGTVWVVGGGLFEGRIMEQRRGVWAPVDLGFSVPLLNWVHGTSAADVFVGGNDGTILHYDGQSWRRHETPTTLPVWGLWAQAPDDVWAVGGDNARTLPPLVMRYDGEAWRTVELPPLLRPRVHAFFKVWSAGPEAVWIVGQNGAIVGFDGESFTEYGAGISQDLIGVWGTGTDDVTTVGGRGTAEFAHFDGNSWRRAPQTGRPGLNGIWTRRRGVAHAVGVAGTVLVLDPGGLRVVESVPVPTGLELHAVFGDATGQILAFGANFMFPERGVVLHRGLGAAE